MRPPPPLEPSCRLPSRSATARTPMRKRGWTSCTITPSLVATRISRSSSAKLASALTISGPKAALPGSPARGGRACRRRGRRAQGRQLVAAREGAGADGDGWWCRRRAGGDGGGRLGRTLHRLPGQVFGIGVAGGVAALHPDPDADGHPPRRRLEDALFEAEAAARPVLEEEVGVVAAAGERDAEQALAGGCVDGGVAAGCERRPRVRGHGEGGHGRRTLGRKRGRVEPTRVREEPPRHGKGDGFGGRG